MPPDSITIHGKTHALNFTYDQLEKKVNGDKNIGELKFGSDGKLHRINNHATFTSWNNTVLTGEENYEARLVTWKLINSRWQNDDSGRRLDLLNEAQKLLLGDDVAHEPVSRDEVRLILSMLKNGGFSTEEMSTAVTLVRHIKKTGGQNAAALLEQGGFRADAVGYFVKGWNLSTVAQKRSDNFANWAEKANALEMDKFLSELKADGTVTSSQMETFKSDFTRILAEALREAGFKVNQPVGTEPGAYKNVLNDALAQVSRIKDENIVSRIKAKLRERMMQNVEDTLLGGNGRIICSQTLELQKALQKMQKDVASSFGRLWAGISKNGRNWASYNHWTTSTQEALMACGVKRANIQEKVIDVTVLHLDGRTEKKQVADTDENLRNFALDKEPYGAGQGKVYDVRHMARVRTSPIQWQWSEKDQTEDLDIPQDNCFEMPGLGGRDDLYTVVPQADALQRQYVDRIKGKLAGAFDDIFNGTRSLSQGCRKLLDERADLFTRPAINRLAEKESAAIQDHEIKTLTGALSKYVNFYSGDQERLNYIRFSFEDLLDTYRYLEGPVEDLSVEDFGRRIAMRKELGHLSAVLSNGKWDDFDGLGFGFPPDLMKNANQSMLLEMMRQVKKNDIPSYGPIIKLACSLLRKAGGQQAVDAIALNLLSLYKMTDRDLDMRLVKRQSGSNDEEGNAGFDVLGKLGEVVDAIVTSKKKREERRENLHITGNERNVFDVGAREGRCQRARNAIERIWTEMGWKLKVDTNKEGKNVVDAEGKDVLILAQGNRVLRLPESQPVQSGAVAGERTGR